MGADAGKTRPITGDLFFGVHVYLEAGDAELVDEGGMRFRPREIRLVGNVDLWLNAPGYQHLGCIPLTFHSGGATRHAGYFTPTEVRPMIEDFRARWRGRAGPEGAKVITLKRPCR